MTKVCLWVDIQDLITYATFSDDQLRGLGVTRGRIYHFPIHLRRRPCNTLALSINQSVYSEMVAKWLNSYNNNTVIQ